MGNPWFRRWVGAISDPKIAEAAMIAETSRSVVNSVWDAILESASEVDERGAFSTTPRRVAATLCEPLLAIERVFAAMDDLGMIRLATPALVVAWEKRQPSTESRAEAAERQRQAREAARRAAGEARAGCHNLSQDVTPPESETETDIHPPPARGREKSDWGGLAPNVVPLRAVDPLEAECRVLAAGLRLAEDEDFSAVAALVAAGEASRQDVLAAIEDGRAAEPSCPRRWAKIADWARRKAARTASARASPTVAGRGSGTAVCVELAGGNAPPGAPRPPPDAVAASALARCRPGLSQSGGRVEIEAACAPSAAERAALMARRLALDGALKAAGREAARREAAKLFLAIPDGRPDREETREKIEAIAAALERLPGFAIAEACAGAIAGGAKYRPGAGDLVRAAKRAGDPLWLEAQRIGEVLGATARAPRPSAEDRARSVAEYRARTGGKRREGTG
jgi:hypothetical protein